MRGITWCEIPDVEECCGFGGTFSVKMPGTSLAMGRSKAENVVRSGAEVVVSPDISCLMHLGGILERDPATRHIRAIAHRRSAGGEVNGCVAFNDKTRPENRKRMKDKG